MCLPPNPTVENIPRTWGCWFFKNSKEISVKKGSIVVVLSENYANNLQPVNLYLSSFILPMNVFNHIELHFWKETESEAVREAREARARVRKADKIFWQKYANEHIDENPFAV